MNHDQRNEITRMNNWIEGKELNRKALFADGTKQYRTPWEPDKNETVHFRFRTGKQEIDGVYFCVGEFRYKMLVESEDALFHYYGVDYNIGVNSIRYWFEIQVGEEVCYFNTFGDSLERKPDYDFFLTPGYKTPNWAKGAVIYQIFVDRFCNGDTSNDVLNREYVYIGEECKEVNNWYKYPDSNGIREFYGGDLQGVLNKLDYLKELGVEVIYLNPIFVSPSNHKYDTQDYDYVDPHFGVIVNDGGEVLPEGIKNNAYASKYKQRVTKLSNLEATNQFFVQLVEEIHKRDMKIILDGVFNHCGSFNKWLDRERLYEESEDYETGAYVDKDSPYHSFFRFYKEEWPYNYHYDGWWGHDTLPKLNYEESPKLFEYIMKIAKKWISPPYSADGWRLDVAADLGHSSEYNHYFWQEFRKRVKEENEEALIVAEHYGDAFSWLQGDQWDTVMNYDAFMEPVTWFLTGMEKHSDEYRPQLIGDHEYFIHSMKKAMSRFQSQSLYTAMNELSNHDHSRFLTRTNHVVGRTQWLGPDAANEGVSIPIFMEAVVMLMTWPGAPTIYYGDEAGLCGFTDPDNRRTYPWGRENHNLIQFHKDMIRIHKSYEALKTGSLKFMYSEKNLLVYTRFDAMDKFIVIIHHNEEPMELSLEVWEAGITDQDTLVELIRTKEEGYSMEAVTYKVEMGRITISLSPMSGVVLKNILW